MSLAEDLVNETLTQFHRKILLPYLIPYEVPEDCPVHQEVFTPKLVAGDTVQGILEAKYVAHYYSEETISGSYSETRFEALL